MKFGFCIASLGLRTISGHFTSFKHIVGSWLSVGWVLDKMGRKDSPVQLNLSKEVREGAIERKMPGKRTEIV